MVSSTLTSGMNLNVVMYTQKINVVTVLQDSTVAVAAQPILITSMEASQMLMT